MLNILLDDISIALSYNKIIIIIGTVFMSQIYQLSTDTLLIGETKSSQILVVLQEADATFPSYDYTFYEIKRFKILVSSLNFCYVITKNFLSHFSVNTARLQ